MQITLYPTADTYDSSANPNTNFGTGANMDIFTNYGGATAGYGYFTFDLSSLTNYIVTGAIFYLKTTTVPATGLCTVTQVTSTWAEDTETYNTKPTVGDSVGSFTPVDAATYYNAAITASLVYGWAKGTTANYGIRLAMADTKSSKFASKETALTTSDPYLVVTYMIAGGIGIGSPMIF